MQSMRKLLAFALLIIVGFLAVKKYSPEKWEKIEGFLSPFIKTTNPVIDKLAKGDFKKVLGEVTEGNNGELFPEQLKQVPVQVLENELVKETIEKLNQTVIKLVQEKFEEVKDLPEQQVDKVTDEVKRQICEDWLEYEGEADE